MPYRGQRYHLSDWGHPPETPKEIFNMRHSSCRNVIERAFGLLKGRWAILRGKSYYPIKVQIRIIVACCLLHNFIKSKNEENLEQIFENVNEDAHGNNSDNGSSSDDDNAEMEQHYTYVASSDTWNAWRDNLAREMFDQWHGNRYA